jgi:Kef-type K+ transport system membrane component KefB
VIVGRRWPLGAVLLMGSGPDPSIRVVLTLAVFYLVALAFGEAAVRVGQPAVLGELVGGVVLGNLPLLGIHGFAFMATDPGVDLLARIGILVLLFEVGLESTVHQMLSVGLKSLVVALIRITVQAGAGSGVNRLAVGIGMVPRGEVGLIFASLGLGLTLAGAALITPQVYSALVAMVIVTTMATPPALKWAFGRSGGAR